MHNAMQQLELVCRLADIEPADFWDPVPWPCSLAKQMLQQGSSKKTAAASHLEDAQTHVAWQQQHPQDTAQVSPKGNLVS